MHEFNHNVKNGIAYFNDESKIIVLEKNGTYDILYNSIRIMSGLDDIDAEVNANPDVIIGHDGILYNSGKMPYSSTLNITFPEPPLELFKATNSQHEYDIPGFMAYDLESIRKYLPGGRYHRHYGGRSVVKTIITNVEPLPQAEIIDSANFGLILILPATPSVIDIGEYDGVIVLQKVKLLNVTN